MKGAFTMKKDRNWGMGMKMGLVPNYSGMVMPGGVIPMPGAAYPTGGIPNSLNNYGSTDLSTLSNQLNSLEQRVNRLENLVGNGSYSNNYNSSNYQMM